MTTPLLTVAKAAERLGVSDDTVRALVRAGKLSHIRIGTGEQKPPIRFTEEDLAAFITRHRHVAAADREYPDVSRVPHRLPRRSLANLDEAKRYG